jgi:crossover junction endodeoxyribonuclease RuvC
MIILGIDPGYDRCGIAILMKEERMKDKILFSACIQTSPRQTFQERISEIGNTLEDTIKTYKPLLIASESLFFNQNITTAIPVAGVRGVIAYLASKYGVQHLEFTPLQVKVAVTGYGRSEKSQVKHMVQKLVEIEAAPKKDDEYDAIAVSLTASAHYRFL